MKNLLLSKANQRNLAKTAKSIDSKKIFAIAMTTFLLLVLASEGLKLALQAW